MLSGCPRRSAMYCALGSFPVRRHDHVISPVTITDHEHGVSPITPTAFIRARSRITNTAGLRSTITSFLIHGHEPRSRLFIFCLSETGYPAKTADKFYTRELS